MKRILITVLVLCTLAMIPGCRTYDDGYQAGKDSGYDIGYDVGYEMGLEEGKNNPNTALLNQRYWQGYLDGKNNAEASEPEYNSSSSASNSTPASQSQTVVVTATGEKYHKSNCYHVEGRIAAWYSIEEARNLGYEPCLDCF